MTRSIILAVEVAASDQSVFDAISTQEGLASFWTPDVAGRPDAGARVRFGFAAAPVPLEMTVTRLEAPERIEWECSGPWPHWGGTRVEWALSGSEPVMVLFRHLGWADEQPEVEFGSVAHTWATVLTALKAYAETGVAAPALA